MESDALSIGELADAVGLSRRAIRFYVQQKLLPPPTGRGRGSHYDRRHADQLRRVLELQQAGHSLDAIRRLLADGTPAPPVARVETEPPPAVVRAELWTRLRLGDGIELSFDATRFNPTVEQLLRVREAVREGLMKD